MRVTAEVTPHHLSLDDGVIRSYDPVYKVNPPLRTDADVEALRAALADGTIDASPPTTRPTARSTRTRSGSTPPAGCSASRRRSRWSTPNWSATGLLDPLTAIARLTTGPAGVRDVGGHGGAIARRTARPTSPSSTRRRPGRSTPRRSAPKARNTPVRGRGRSPAGRSTRCSRGRFTLARRAGARHDAHPARDGGPA